MTAADIKALILEGAQRGGRTANGIPVLNAYESLRAAAERPGGRLCGNRVWFEGDGIVVQRVAPGQGQAEVLDTIVEGLDPADMFSLLPLHGGGHIQFGSGREVAFSPAAGWQLSSQPVQPVDTLRYGGSLASSWGQSHGLDTIASGYFDNGTNHWVVWLSDTSGTWDDSLTAIAAPSQGSGEVCTVRLKSSHACEHVIDLSWLKPPNWTSFDFAALAYSQVGDTVFLARPRYEASYVDSTSWSSCSFAPSTHDCRSMTIQWRVAGSQVHAISVLSGAVNPYNEETGFVFQYAQAESGERMTVRGEAKSAWTWSGNQPVPGSQVDTVSDCEVEFEAPGGTAYQRSLADACPWGGVSAIVPAPPLAGAGTEGSTTRTSDAPVLWTRSQDVRMVPSRELGVRHPTSSRPHRFGRRPRRTSH